MSSFDINPDPIYLPDHRQDNDFAIEIPLDPTTLSTKLSDIKECLKLEFAPIQIWHRIGIELYRHGLDIECNSLLGLALEDDLEHISDWNTTVCSYEGNPENHINLLNAATIQAINTINKLHNSNSNSDEYKLNIRKATQYYQLARNIAQTYDHTEKYNMVLHFLAGLIQIEKAKHKKEDIFQIMIKTKHDLQKAVSWKEMEDDDDDMMNNYNENDENDPKKIPLQREPNFISLLCIAVLSYATGEYEDALTNFTKLLKMSIKNNNNNELDSNNTNYLGFVHLGIGISSLKLKEFDIARHAFERAKKIDKVIAGDKVGYVGIKSRIGLALVYLNQYDYTCSTGTNDNNIENNKKKQHSMKKALREITDAMLYCPSNPQLLVLMANFIGFSCDNIQFCKMWAGTAYFECRKMTGLLTDYEPSHTEIMNGLDTKHFSSNKNNSNRHPLSKCQSEACYVIGKMYHICNDYTEAIKWYYKSIILFNNFKLSLFGLSQMYIYFNKLNHSRICLERILSINRETNECNDVCVLSHYAYVCRKCGEFEKAKENLLSAIQLNPFSTDLYIDLAEITEQKDPSFAVNKYMRARQILNTENREIPFELFNNIIVLFYELGEYSRAKKLSEELLEIMKEESDDNNNNNINDKNSKNIIPSNQIIIQYNYARILDKLSFYKRARKIYRQILLSCPTFIEAILCNALYLYRSGKFMDCIRKLEDAVIKATEFNFIDLKLNVLLYIHRIYLEIGRRSDSEQVLTRIDELKRNNKSLNSIYNDEYSELISANYLLRNSRGKNYYRRLHDALQKYQQILVVNENNVYAVHGLAVIAAESIDNLSISKNILSSISKSIINLECLGDIYSNLGYIYSFQQEWDSALKCYEKARKKILLAGGSAGDIPLYIIRTLFAKKDFNAAKLQLYQILRYNPTQELYLYNLALIEEEFACDILRKDPRQRTLIEIENVMKMLENARRLYQRLQINRRTATQIPHDKLKQHLDHIKNELLQNAKKHLQFQKQQQVKNEKKRIAEEKKLKKELDKEKKKIKEKQLRIWKLKHENKLKAQAAKCKAKQIQLNAPEKRRQQQIDREPIQPSPEPPMKKRKINNNHNEHHMDQFIESNENDNNNNNNMSEDDIDILGDEEQMATKKLKKKKKKKHKNKNKNKNKNNNNQTDNNNNNKNSKHDQQIWEQMEIKIQEIVQNADLNTLTNRQVKNKLAQHFVNINIKVYKKLIKQKINQVAQSKADQNE